MHITKVIFFTLLYAFAVTYACAQSADPAYQLQRKKINALLNSRHTRFGQYEQSLSMRTGIFGLKTKKDMQRSINILTDIVKTDNNILRETRVLLDYKDLEKTQVESRASNTEERISGYMVTITKLQKHNEELRANMLAADKEKTALSLLVFALGLLLCILLFLFFRKKTAEPLEPAS